MDVSCVNRSMQTNTPAVFCFDPSSIHIGGTDLDRIEYVDADLNQRINNAVMLPQLSSHRTRSCRQQDSVYSVCRLLCGSELYPVQVSVGLQFMGDLLHWYVCEASGSFAVIAGGLIPMNRDTLPIIAVEDVKLNRNLGEGFFRLR